MERERLVVVRIDDEISCLIICTMRNTALISDQRIDLLEASFSLGLVFNTSLNSQKYCVNDEKKAQVKGNTAEQ